MQSNTGFLSSFLKTSLFTVLIMGGLLAQSYATTGLFTGVKMNAVESINRAEMVAVRSQVVSNKVEIDFEDTNLQANAITITTE